MNELQQSDKTTWSIAEIVASHLNCDRYKWYTNDGISFEDLCCRYKASVEYGHWGVTHYYKVESAAHRVDRPIRYVFPDGSVLVTGRDQYGPRWGFEGSEAFTEIQKSLVLQAGDFSK